jgi:CRP-like cAMP-binding protein
MEIAEKVRILKTFPLFSGIEYEALEALAGKMIPKSLEKSKVFIEQGVDSTHAYFLYEGVASTYRTTEDGEIVHVDILGAPEVVGELGLIDHEPNQVSAIALRESNSFVLSQKDFTEIITQYPSISFIFFKLFADTVKYFNSFLEELFSKNLHDRLEIILEHLATFFPNREITLSHEELADLLWGTRARVTEVLHELEDEGKVTLLHRKIRVT